MELGLATCCSWLHCTHLLWLFHVTQVQHSPAIGSLHTWSTDGTGEPLAQLLRIGAARPAGGLLLAMTHYPQAVHAYGAQLASTRLYKVYHIRRGDRSIAYHQGAQRDPDARQAQQYDQQQKRCPGQGTLQHDGARVLVCVGGESQAPDEGCYA